jgi:phage terminase small subunit
MARPLTPMQRKFVEAMAAQISEDGIAVNQRAAAIEAGCSEVSAHTTSDGWLNKPEIRAAIDELWAQRAAKADLTALWVLKRWREIATADATELIAIHRVACRHCHGLGHRYQWTEAEYRSALDAAIAAGKPAPDAMGGLGFDCNAAPAEGCPECGGRGVEVMHIPDTRTLSPQAKLLYAGVRKTNAGMQVLMRDRDAALLNIAKYLGMLVERRELTGKDGTPLAMPSVITVCGPDD